VQKKILIITECFYPEEFKINDVALSWKEKGYSVGVLTLFPTYPLGKIYPGYKNKLYSKTLWRGINIYRVRAVLGYKNSKIKKILKYLNFAILGSITSIFIGKRYDYVLGFNMSALTSMLPAILIRKFYKKPTTFWALDLWPDSVYAYGFKKTKPFSYLLDKFISFSYSAIDNIAISSRGFESRLRPYVKGSPVFNYLPQWADDLNMDLNPAKFGHDNKIQFTFAGNIGKFQNLDTIIKAFGSLSYEYQERSQFNIIGDGSHVDALKLLADNNPNIIFYGKQPRVSMASYYKASDFLIISLVDNPIFSATVPAKTQTYISAKRPILAIINGETADLIRDNNLGICADPSDIDNIIAILKKCIDMSASERRNFVGLNDYLLSTVFNKTTIIRRLLDLTIGKEI